MCVHRSWSWGERLESRFGKLGREYKKITFDKNILTNEPTLEWVTLGHPLFECVREELDKEKSCTIADIQHYGSAWVLPHPERHSPEIAPMVSNTEIEQTAVEAAIAYE